MKRRIGFRALAVIIVMAMIMGPAAPLCGNTDIRAEAASGTESGAEASDKITAASLLGEYSNERLERNYTLVSAGYSFRDYSGADIIFNISDVLDGEYTELLSADSRGYGNSVLSLKSGDSFSVAVEVPEDGLYFVGFDYLSYDESILPIEFSLMTDDGYPFYEARSFSFETTWVSNGEKSLDRYGNEIVVLPDKLVRWEHKNVSDGSHRYSRPLKLELAKGTHVFRIDVNEGTFLLGNITLSAPEVIPEYTGSERAEGDALITIEAEDFYERNDSSVHATGEYDSAISPTYYKETVLNTVDEDSFSDAGQKITYSFSVEKAGVYNIAVNYRQSEKNGFPVFINYEIDGNIPNTAFLNYPMAYSTSYSRHTLANENGESLSLRLEPGMHTISMEISADPVRYALEEVDRIISEVSDLSLEVTKVAGTNTDNNRYRDLKLTRYIPGLQEKLYGWVDKLRSTAKLAGAYVLKDDAEDVAAFSYLLIAADQLETLAEEPNELIYRVDELSTSTNSINTQIANFVDIVRKNNISVDRIYIFQEDAKLPGKPGVFRSLMLSLKRFFYSFFGQSYSASNTNPEHVQVWVNRPRQYVEVMQKMIDDDFTAKTGIEVDLSLMTDAQKLILSNASGDTPDIATGINYSIPFEMGIRGALVDLTRFDDYKEVFGRYSDGLLVPSVIGDGLYSLPETMNFYVMFCRTDILDKLGLTVPDTMEELVAMLPDLQMRGLNVYYPTAVMTAMRNFHGTTPLIYQNGGVLYGETALDLMIDSEETIEGFTQLTDLFTIYNMPVDVPNFYQHFRNGDLAIGIADFNSYNLILNAAPEIENAWSIYPVPGVRDKETGEIHRYMSGGAESTVMFTSNDEREQKAWRFMEWWSSADVQAEFGQMIQIMYGDEYIWPTANLEAFERLPYPSSDKDIIMTQAQEILEAPRLLGSYMLERELSNAFVDIVAQGETLRPRMDEAVKTVNRETLRKLEEFEYVDEYGNVLVPYMIPSVSRVREILER